MCLLISRFLYLTASYRTFCRIISILGSVFIINYGGFVITRFLLIANARFINRLILTHLMAYTMVKVINFNVSAWSLLITLFSSIVDLNHYVIYAIKTIIFTYLVQLLHCYLLFTYFPI